MKAPTNYKYYGPLSGLTRAAHAEALRREAPAEESRWALLYALLALLLLAGAGRAPAQPEPAPVAAIAHL